MTSSFRYDDLPVELKWKVLEHVFANCMSPTPIHIKPLNVRKTTSYRLRDEYFDTFYNCTIPSELTLYPDPRFCQLFVSKDFLQNAIPIFANQNPLEIQLNSYRTMNDDSPGSGIFQQTLKEVLSHVHEITITHSILARDNHLDEQRLAALLSASRLRGCNMVIEKPRFWFRQHLGLRTTIVGHLTNFAFSHNLSLRNLTEKEINELRDNKQPPIGFMDLLDGEHAPPEVTWHCDRLLPMLRDQGFTGSAWFQIDIVACRNSNSPIPLMPTSYVGVAVSCVVQTLTNFSL